MGKTIEVWDIAERRLTRSLNGPNGSVREVLVDPSGRYLAAQVLDTDPPELIDAPPALVDGSPPLVNAPQAMSPPKYISEFFLWDLSTGAVVSSEKATGSDDAPVDSIRLLAFHPSGDRLIRCRQQHAFSDGSDVLQTTAALEVMETSSGKILRRDEVPCTVDRACFAHGGTVLYYAAKFDFTEPGQQQGIWVWNLATDRRTRLHSQPVASLAISPDESRLMFMSGIQSEVNQSLVLIETETHQKVFEMPVSRNAGNFAFTSDGGIVRYSTGASVERLLSERGPAHDGESGSLH